MIMFKIIALIVALINFNNCLIIQDLGGQWLLKDGSNENEFKDLIAKVPGGIYTDLMNNSIIDDVFYGYNDNKTRWVSEKNWTYYTKFTVDEDLLNNDNINIVFEGLDTFATIILNDKIIGQSESMFIRYSFDVKNVIKSGENNIEVQFQSPIEVSATLAKKVGYSIPPECPPDEFRGFCHANQIRKMQASYSWDWGPAFPSVGIWKNVTLEGFNSTYIRYVIVNPVISEKKDNQWTLLVRTFLENNKKALVQGELKFNIVLDDGTSVNHTTKIDNSPNEYYEILSDTSILIDADKVQKWWPNGYGEQILYDFKTTFTSTENEKHEKTVRIGFRTFELVEDELAKGLSFYFKVNNIPFFAKGANEIPINILPELGQNKETIRFLLKSAKEVNMNMLRVWGGGIYESDYFYDVADEFGILIWQDFMFACAMYPAYKEYFNLVTEEVNQQFKRISGHASLIVWAGNNENEGILAEMKSDTNYSLYRSDYVNLLLTEKNEVNRLAKNPIIFVPSSPSNGKQTVADGYASDHPYDPTYGDVHFYNYDGDGFNSQTFPIPRFASEYGYQSMPVIESWLTATNDTDNLNPDSNFVDHRQHHPGGHDQNKVLIENQLKLPVNKSTYYKTFIYYSQVVQAESIKVETEHYRTFMGRYDNDGKGNTMGALFWQLNDVWVGPTWSSIDFTGRWKLLHYFAKRFFAPIIITGRLNDDKILSIYAINDILLSSIDATASVSVLTWGSFEPLTTKSYNISLEYLTNLLVDEFNAEDFLKEAGCGDNYDNASNNCFVHFELKENSEENDNELIAPINYLFPGKLKNANYTQPINLQIDSITQSNENSNVFEIVVTSDKIALFVTLDSHQIKGRFSENGFLLASPSKTITFEAEEKTTLDDFKKVLTITHVFDSEHLQ